MRDAKAKRSRNGVRCPLELGLHTIRACAERPPHMYMPIRAPVREEGVPAMRLSQVRFGEGARHRLLSWGNRHLPALGHAKRQLHPRTCWLTHKTWQANAGRRH